MGVDFAFLDSGTGGIPYMLSLKEKVPSASCVYLGDTAHFPYGQKTQKEVVAAASKAVELIQKKWNPKTLIVACNTISVTALDDLRARFPSLPIVGTVPAIKLAAKVTANKRVGLLATNATVRHPYSQKLIEDFASDCAVFKRGDPDLIDFIEKKLFTASRAERLAAVRPAVDYFAANGCDTIILGCTHFTHIAEDIQAAAGDKVRVIDSREGVANQALRVFPGNAKNCLQAQTSAKTDDGASSKEAALFGREKNCLQDQAFSQDQNAGGFRVSEKFPQDKSFFFTAATREQESEYRAMCERFAIPFGGMV
ncbi:MAG: glutamate racemase [Treponema sp.]|nr:glutamate racemase [Treponema sp.]